MSQSRNDHLCILTQPERFHDVPVLFQHAWSELKAERGQTVDPDKWGPMQHQCADQTPLQARIQAKVRAHCAARGLATRDCRLIHSVPDQAQ